MIRAIHGYERSGIDPRVEESIDAGVFNPCEMCYGRGVLLTGTERKSVVGKTSKEKSGIHSSERPLAHAPDLSSIMNVRWLIRESVGIVGSSYGSDSGMKNGMGVMRIGQNFSQYTDMYSMLRACVHIRRSGGYLGVRDGELQAIFANRQALKQYVAYIFDPATCGLQIERECRMAMVFVSNWLKEKRKPMLAAARNDVNRSMIPLDSLGRHNPGAAAMSIGGAIVMLERADTHVRAMLGRIGKRDFLIHQEIVRSVGVFLQLRNALGGKDGRKRNGPILKFLYGDPLHRNTEQALKAIRHLRNALLHPMLGHPFRNTAVRTVEDLRILTRLLKARGPMTDILLDECRIVVRRIRQGIAWVFTRDELERLIIAPLSCVIHDTERKRGYVAKAVNAHSTDEVGCTISIVNDPERLGDILGRLMTFSSQIEKIPDGLLVHSPKSEFLANIEAATSQAQEDDWQSAYESLGSAVRVLQAA